MHRVADGDAVFSPRLAGLRPRRVPLGRRRRRRRARPAHRARARGAAADRPRLPLQGDRRPPAPVGEDRGEPRLGGAPQAPALEPPRADALGGRTAPDLTTVAGLGARPSDHDDADAAFTRRSRSAASVGACRAPPRAVDRRRARRRRSADDRRLVRARSLDRHAAACRTPERSGSTTAKGRSSRTRAPSSPGPASSSRRAEGRCRSTSARTAPRRVLRPSPTEHRRPAGQAGRSGVDPGSRGRALREGRGVERVRDAVDRAQRALRLRARDTVVGRRTRSTGQTCSR